VKGGLRALAAFLFAAISLEGAPFPAPPFYLQETQRYPGQVLRVRAQSPSLPAEHAKAFRQEASFFAEPGSGHPLALLAIPLEARPGPQRVEIGGRWLGFQLRANPVKPQLIRLSAKASKAADSLPTDKKVLDKALLTDGPPLWLGPFLPPSLGRLSTPFGAPRLYLPGEYRWFHKGMDFAMPVGTTLCAAQDGVVALAADLKAFGKVVVLSHGCGLSSTCMHMSRLDVKAGDKVSRGQALGLSGSEGISTGPHLHFQMNLRGFPVDPLEWLQFPPPGDEIHSKATGEKKPLLK